MSTFSISAADYRAGDHGSVERLNGIYFHHFIVVDDSGTVVEFTKHSGQIKATIQFGHVSNYKNDRCFKTIHENVNVKSAVGKAIECVADFKNNPTKYNFFTENCECLVNYCFYGDSTSRQFSVGMAALASSSFVLSSAVFGTAIAAMEIEKSVKDKKNGLITSRQNAEVITSAVACGSSRVACAVAGAVIGQIICPVPVLGGFVGSAVGTVVGHVAGKASSSFVSRIFRRKK